LFSTLDLKFKKEKTTQRVAWGGFMRQFNHSLVPVNAQFGSAIRPSSILRQQFQSTGTGQLFPFYPQISHNFSNLILLLGDKVKK